MVLKPAPSSHFKFAVQVSLVTYGTRPAFWTQPTIRTVDALSPKDMERSGAVKTYMSTLDLDVLCFPWSICCRLISSSSIECFVTKKVHITVTGDMTVVQLQLAGIIIVGAIISDRLLSLFTRLLFSRTEKASTLSLLPWKENIFKAPLRNDYSTSLMGRGYLEDLPCRFGRESNDQKGRAPTQTTFNVDERHTQVRQMMTSLVERYPDELYFGHDSTEASSGDLSMYSKRKFHHSYTDWRGKVIEHRSDGIVHAKLHPADAELVWEKGWSTLRDDKMERSRRFSWWPSQRSVSDPKSLWVYLHKPRAQYELEVVGKVLRAAAWCAATESGSVEVEEQDLQGKEKDELR